MGKFQFQDNSVHIEIAGHAFSVPGTVEYAEKLRTFGLQAQEKAAELGERSDEAEALAEGITFIWDSLNAILGAGAAETIFSGRERNLYDAIDVLMYINEEFAAFQRGKQGQYSGVAQYSPNRAQRRANPVVSLAPPVLSKEVPPLDVSALARDPAFLAALAQSLAEAGSQ